MIHPETFATLVGPGQTFAQEVAPVDVVPRLADELVVHVHSTGLHVATGSRQFLVRQRRRMILFFFKTKYFVMN